MTVPSSLRSAGEPERRSRLVIRWTRSRVIGLATVVAIAAAATVDMRLPARIDIGSETLIVNGLRPVLVGARLLNRHGRAIWHPGLQYSAVSPAVARSASDGSVACTGIGDGTLTISHGSLERQMLVRCRPIKGFGFPGGVSLRLGGPPKELVVRPFGPDRRLVTLLRGRAILRDTGVARLRDNLVYPVAIGFAFVEVEFSGGPTTRIGVSVTRMALDTSLTLVGGEIRTFHLTPGYYELTLEARGTSRDSLQLAAVGANCARGRKGPQDYWCIMGDSSALIVMNANRAGSGRERSAHLSAEQFPHAGAAAARRVSEDASRRRSGG